MKTESAQNGFSSVSQIKQIQKIAVVGGFQGFENDPECKDFKMVIPALDYMRRSGISISQKPEFDTINFADKRNFLDEEQKYDMVFIAHIPNGRNLSWTRMTFNRFSRSTDVAEPSKLANTIDSQNSPDRWAGRISQTGAAIVAAVGTYIEIGTNYLSESEKFKDYQVLVTPKNDPSLVGRADIFKTDQMELVYGHQLDLPIQWLSIAVQPDKIKPFVNLNSNTDLGKIFAAEKITPVAQPSRLSM